MLSNFVCFLAFIHNPEYFKNQIGMNTDAKYSNTWKTIKKIDQTFNEIIELEKIFPELMLKNKAHSIKM